MDLSLNIAERLPDFLFVFHRQSAISKFVLSSPLCVCGLQTVHEESFAAFEPPFGQIGFHQAAAPLNATAGAADRVPTGLR